MKRNKTLYVGLAVIGFGTLLAFQNCGQGVLENNAGEAQSSSQLSEIENVKAGDPFDAAKLPHTPQAALVTDIANYPTMLGYKSMAIAPTGLGVARGSERFADQAEANQNVLEMCQLVSGNLPCVTVAEGDVFKYSYSEFQQAEAAAVSVIDSGVRTVAADRIPGFSRYWEALFTTQYAETTNPSKAIAISPYGLVIRGWGANQAEATRRALEMCDAAGEGAFCTLYAEGANVLFNVTTFNLNTTKTYLKFGPLAFVAAEVPFVTNAQRASAQLTGYLDLARTGRKPVMAISRYGHVAVSAVATNTLAQNEAAALAACTTSLNDVTRGCIVYARDSSVVMNRADMKAAKF